jgi:TRAP-type C4-dicarboxylate transport system permease small subunit
MKKLSQMLNRTEWVVRVFSTVGTIAIGCITSLIFIDVMARNVFDFAFQGAGEISEYLLVLIAFFGLGYAQLTGTHVRIEVLFSRLPPRLKRIMNIFIMLLLIAFFIIMTWQIGKEAYRAWAENISHWGTTWLLPTWPAHAVAFVGCVLLLISFLIQLLRGIGKMDSSAC